MLRPDNGPCVFNNIAPSHAMPRPDRHDEWLQQVYKVVSSDGCYNIAHAAGINLDDFYSRNSAAKNNYTGLQANIYVCVGVDTATATIAPTITTSSGWRHATPTPT